MVIIDLALCAFRAIGTLIGLASVLSSYGRFDARMPPTSYEPYLVASGAAIALLGIGGNVGLLMQRMWGVVLGYAACLAVVLNLIVGLLHASASVAMVLPSKVDRSLVWLGFGFSAFVQLAILVLYLIAVCKLDTWLNGPALQAAGAENALSRTPWSQGRKVGLTTGASFAMLLLVVSLGYGLRVASLPPAPKPPPPVPSLAELPEAQRLPKAVEMLRSNLEPHRAAACDYLALAPVDPNHYEVARELERLMTDRSAKLPATAAKALTVWARPETPEELRRFLRSEHFDTPKTADAMTVLESLKGNEAAEALADLLNSRRDKERAAKALKAMGATAEPAVRRVVANEQLRENRDLACQVLAEIGTKASIDALKEAKQDRSPKVRDAARSALIAINRREGLQNSIDQVAEALDNLTSPDKNEVIAAVGYLSLCKPDPAKPEITRALEKMVLSNNSPAREQAMKALAVWATPETLTTITGVANDPKIDKNRRMEAVELLLTLKSPAGADAARELFLDWGLRGRARTALEQMGLPAQPAILKLFDENDGRHREEACDMLAKIGDAQALPALTKQLTSLGRFSRDRAKRAIAAIRARAGIPADEIGDAILAISTKEHDDVIAGSKNLAQLTPDARRAEVAKALEEIVLKTRDDWGQVQEAALALAVWYGPDTATQMATLARDEARQPFTRAAAMTVLAGTKTPEAAEVLASRLYEPADQHHAAEQLKKMGPVAEKAVITRLKDPVETARELACDVLKVVGTKECLQALKSATKDKSGHIQRKAQEAYEAVSRRS
jgi:HEAT repeat protein